MIKIGLIGEDENDTSAFAHLMKQKYNEGYSYRPLAKSKTGSQLFNPAAVRSYNFEISKWQPSLVVVVIDADAVANDTSKIELRKRKYDYLKAQLGCRSMLLLNIYELEALILADIDTVRSRYRDAGLTFSGNVMHQPDPKGYLKAKTGNRYQVSHCPDLFKELKFDTVRQNCAYFHDFVQEFEKALTSG